ncbi:XK-related protein 7 [Chironomus tepperi]|uniref:XK-related protein 7 n=1 Tax=Chironomus tepperi TaxID=113505 RepID=UPI00391F4779
MVEATEMRVLREERTTKIFNAVKDVVLNEQVDFRVTKLDIVSNVVSILFRLFTVLFNAYLAYEYYAKGEILFFKLTLCFILIPAFISIALSITLHYEDSKLEDNKRKKGYCSLIFFVVIFPYTLRFMQSLIYQIKSLRAQRNKDEEKQRLYYKLMVMEESDVALIRIIEMFLDSCPHKIIHMTAIVNSGFNPTYAQILSLSSAFSGFAWSMAAYQRCIRLAQPDKRQLSFAGICCQCVWHFLVTFARVLSIVLLTSVFPYYSLIGIASHAFLMTLWVFLLDRSKFCSYTSVHSFAFSMIFGAVFIFTYILMKETKNTFSRYLFYYCLTGIENLIAIIIFFMYTTISIEIAYILSIAPIISFACGIGAMIFYYKYLHPNILSRRDLVTEL